MRYLAGSLADGVLADAILIPPCPPIPPSNIRKVRAPRKKSTETSNTKTIYFLVNEKRKCRDTLKSTETRDELSTTCNPKSKLCQDACQRQMLHSVVKIHGLVYKHI